MKRFSFILGLLISPLIAFAQDQNQIPVSDFKLDSIVISSIRAGENTPVTFTEMSKKQLNKAVKSHSLPMMLNLQPSVVATTEGGLGLGYSKMSVRGTDDTRTNVTLNGIALNNSESQSVVWVNLPSMSSFLKSAQLQRGVGTSSNGSAAFGASLNMETVNAQPQAYGAAEVAFGSYDTYMTTIAAGSGVSRNGFSLDVIYSHNNTKGYIRNAKANLNSLFATLSWRNANNSLKFNYLFGDQTTGITWEGCNPDKYKEDRRYNVAGEYYDEQGNVYYYDNETDNYQQNFAQLIYTHEFNPYLNWNTTFNFTKGHGYYEDYKYDAKFSKYGYDPLETDNGTLKRSDFLIQQLMDNEYYSANTSLMFNRNGWKVTGSLSYEYYTGDHYGDVLWCKHMPIEKKDRWYNNNGTKQDYSAFAKAEWTISPSFTVYADLQYRGVQYELQGPDKDFTVYDWKNNYNFFNPKAGVTYNLSQKNRFYASVAVAHREPSRSDIKESVKAGTADRLNHERLTDVEIGYRYASENFTVSVNGYFMEYKDQLVATGKLSETGYVIKENIPDSYRRGIELALGWQICKPLRFDANFTWSKNKAINYTAYVDTYDNAVDWNPVPQTAVFMEKTNLVHSPEYIGMFQITVNPIRSMEISLNGKYVGRQYMDNFTSQESKVPAYFVAGLNISKDFRIKGKSTLTLSGTVDNLFNNKYWSYGWIYRSRFADGTPESRGLGIYAQAPANFLFKVGFNF